MKEEAIYIDFFSVLLNIFQKNVVNQKPFNPDNPLDVPLISIL
jgi:hypothetical protein